MDIRRVRTMRPSETQQTPQREVPIYFATTLLDDELECTLTLLYHREQSIS